MRRFKNLLLLLTCSIGFIGVAEAATIQIEDSTAKAGVERNEIKISLSDEDLGSYNKVEFQLSISNTFYAQVTTLTPSTGAGCTFNTSQSGDIVTYIFDAGSSTLSESDLGTIVYRTSTAMDGDFNVTPVNVKFYKTDGTTAAPGDSGVKAIAGIVKYERPKSSEAVLVGLEPSSGTLSPTFDSTLTEYKIQIKDTLTTLRFTATPCQGAQVSGDTVMRDLPMGESTAEITVTAEDGETTTTYTIKIIRGEVTEPSAYLKSLVVNNIGVSLSPKFDSKNNKYTIQIGKDVDELDFKYELEDPMADVKIDGNENFVEGENLVKITVKSSDGKETQVYEITVTKDEEVESKDIVDPNDKDEEKKLSSIWIIVIIVVVILLIVGGVTLILFKKKKKKNKKDDDSKLPLKRREGSEKTVEIDKVIERPKHAASMETEEEPSKKDYPTEQESITEILKSELYEDDRTQRFDRDEFEELKHKIYDEDIDQTKEFSFKDFD